MTLSIALLGHKLAIEVGGLNHIYIETSGHEFFYSREQWFEGRNGRDRRWCLNRKTNFMMGGLAAPTAGE